MATRKREWYWSGATARAGYIQSCTVPTTVLPRFGSYVGSTDVQFAVQPVEGPSGGSTEGTIDVEVRRQMRGARVFASSFLSYVGGERVLSFSPDPDRRPGYLVRKLVILGSGLPHSYGATGPTEARVGCGEARYEGD
ncbi:hypothetical protein R1flu_010374 [Riccia fluitans]|uniref:Uncharacterized protein n=1 Tax=Riccia fluitans TaxID=41844 RepID=A0ABD1Z7U3_9MARC